MATSIPLTSETGNFQVRADFSCMLSLPREKALCLTTLKYNFYMDSYSSVSDMPSAD